MTKISVTKTSKFGRAQYDERTKLRALAHFASSGSVTATGNAVGVAKQTVHDWVHSEHGIEQVGLCRTALRHAIAADLVEVSRQAVSQVRDRLDYGDEVITAKGELVRRKMTGKDCAYVLSNSISQHSLLTQDAKSVTNANLKQLAADLIDSLNAANRVGKIVEGTHTIENPKS